MTEIESGHPGSAILTWYEHASKDEEGYANLIEMVDVLNTSTLVRGPSFLKEASKPEWENRYGWRLQLHSWKANRIKVKKAQTPMLLGSPINFSYLEDSGEASS
jgi:hypothetical protein